MMSTSVVTNGRCAPSALAVSRVHASTRSETTGLNVYVIRSSPSLRRQAASSGSPAIMSRVTG